MLNNVYYNMTNNILQKEEIFIMYVQLQNNTELYNCLKHARDRHLHRSFTNRYAGVSATAILGEIPAYFSIHKSTPMCIHVS